MDDDRYRARVPSLPHPFDTDYGVGLLFIVECERERSSKFACFFEIDEWRSGGRRLEWTGPPQREDQPDRPVRLPEPRIVPPAALLNIHAGLDESTLILRQFSPNTRVTRKTPSYLAK